MAKAGGKVILAGEHAVVYGAPAVAVGLTHGVTAQAQPAEDARLSVAGQPAEPDSEAARAFQRVLAVLHAKPHEAHVELNMPAGVGLGASAAMGVALARAVLEAQGETESTYDPRVLEAAAAWEEVFHGSPSGIDAACAFSGGCIRFDKQRGWQRVRPKVAFDLAIAVAGPATSTRTMVEEVAKLRARNVTLFEQGVEAIRTLARNAELCLTSGDLMGLGRLMNYNQMLLSAWFVSSPEIEFACSVARGEGAFGAKLTGAGGGGCVVALTAAGESESVLSAWRDAGLTCLSNPVRPGGGTRSGAGGSPVQAHRRPNRTKGSR